MSYILRSSLRYSLTKLNFGSASRNNVFLRAALPGFNKFISANHNHSLPSKQEHVSASIDRLLKKLDQDARRMGRLSFRDVQEVVDVISSARDVGVTQSLMLLRCFGNLLIEETPEVRTSNAIQLWKTLEDLGVNLDISHYNALLRVFLENYHDFSPSDILADLQKRQMEPNRVTYQRLIARCCQMGDLDGAFRILEHMNAKEMPVNVSVFNSLILGHSEKNDMKSAEENIEMMKQAGIEPTPESYSTLISGYIKQGNLEKAEELLKNCEAKDLLFSEKDYFDIIYAYGKYGYVDEIDKILGRMNKGPNYNQEAINVIYRFVTDGKDDIAFKILKTLVRNTRTDGIVLPVGGFFITHLVRSNVSAEKIYNYCQEMMKENLNSRALSLAMENTLRYGKEECALELFRKARNDGVVLRPHYFWPLLASRGRVGDMQGIFDTVIRMDREFGVPPSTETIREFVVPYFLQDETVDINSLILELKSCGCGVSTTVCGIVFHYLQHKNLEKAAETASMYRAHYSPYLVRRLLELAYLECRDVNSLVTLLKQFLLGFEQRAKLGAMKGEEQQESVPDGREQIGYMVNDVVWALMKENNLEEISNILKTMLNNGVGIGPNSAKTLKNSLGAKITEALSSVIDKLTSEELVVTAAFTAKSGARNTSSLDINSLERLYETMKAKGESTTTIRKQIFSHYGREKNLEKLLELKEQFDGENFEWTDGMRAHLINAYAENGKVEEAIQLYNEIREKSADFKLSVPMLLRLAWKMAENGKVDDAYQLLQSKSADVERDSDDEYGLRSSALCTKILNVFADKGDVENVKKFFDLVIANKWTEVNNILLGPLIKVHLINDNIDEAMAEFMRCCQKYRFTPFKSELTRKFIEREDAASLQRITDISTDIHGETNVLYDLAFAFLENGRTRQAKKIVETPGLRVRHDRIRAMAEKYRNEGAVEHLENMLKMTEDIAVVDRPTILHQLLLTYNKANDHVKAMALWMQVQEEDVRTPDEFLVALAKLLERNQLPVPFTVPDVVPAGKPKVGEIRLRVNPTSQAIRRLLNQNKLDEALELKEKFRPEQMNSWDWSLLIEACLNQDRYKDAVQLFEQLKSIGKLPHERILKYFLKKAAARGDYESIQSCEPMIPETVRRHVMYSSLLGEALIVAGKSEEYLKNLEEHFENAKSDDEFKQYVGSFPRGGILNLWSKHPELEPRIVDLLEKMRSRDGASTMVNNILWTHYMCNRKYDEAKKVWNSCFNEDGKGVNFRILLATIRETGDIEMGKQLCNFIDSLPGTHRGAVGVTRGVLISTYVQHNLVEEALEVLKDTLKKINLADILQRHLTTLKAACDAKNIEFPYTIPDRSVVREYRRRGQANEEGSDSD